MIFKDIYIDSTALVHESVEIKSGAKVWNWTKIREGAHIGENTNIGQSVYIDFDTIIGDRCKIQNGVSVYNGVSIGNDVFVGPYATFVNDQVPRAHNSEWVRSQTTVRDGVSIGANATILCGITLNEHCMIGAGAVVTKDVPAHALVVGNPAQLIDYVTIKGNRLNWDLNGPLPPHDILIK